MNRLTRVFEFVVSADKDASANAKSIISLLSLGMDQRYLIDISANGEDERSAVER